MKDVFAITALLLSIVSGLPYIRDMIRGTVKPERISWLLWTLLGATYLATAIFEDGPVLFQLGQLLLPFVVLLLSFKYGVGGKSRLDKYSLAIALFAFTVLLITGNAILSLALALTVDAIGAALTIRKVILDPASESRVFWGMNFFAAFFAIMSLSTFTVETMAFPVYLLALTAFLAVKSNPKQVENVEKIEEL